MSESEAVEKPAPEDVEVKPRSKPGYTHERIAKLFSTRNLTTEERVQFLALKKAFEDLCHHVVDVTPSSPHQTIAINKIIEAKDAACLGFITCVSDQKVVGTPEQVVKDPDYYCPVCSTHIVWLHSMKHKCCGATWQYNPKAEPLLLNLKDAEFHDACSKHGKLDKDFKRP